MSPATYPAAVAPGGVPVCCVPNAVLGPQKGDTPLRAPSNRLVDDTRSVKAVDSTVTEGLFTFYAGNYAHFQSGVFHFKTNNIICTV